MSDAVGDFTLRRTFILALTTGLYLRFTTKWSIEYCIDTDCFLRRICQSVVPTDRGHTRYPRPTLYVGFFILFTKFHIVDCYLRILMLIACELFIT